MNTHRIRLYYENGTLAFSCPTRNEISACQSALQALHGKILRCGCRSEIKPKVQIVHRKNLHFPRSLPGQQAFHSVECESCGDEIEGQITARNDVHQICERAFVDAYYAANRESGERSSFFLHRLLERIENELTEAITAAESIQVWTGMFENEPFTITQNSSQLVNLWVKESLTGERQCWSVAPSISFRARTDPSGHTIPCSHVIAGISFSGKPLTHLHAWPTAVSLSGLPHCIHSALESRVINILDEAKFEITKPPSPNFRGCFADAHQQLIEQLVTLQLWPDILVRTTTGQLLVVEVAGLTNAAYRLHLLHKIELYSQLEALELLWVVIRPDKEEFRVTHCSRRFAGINRFDDLIKGVHQ